MSCQVASSCSPSTRSAVGVTARAQGSACRGRRFWFAEGTIGRRGRAGHPRMFVRPRICGARRGAGRALPEFVADLGEVGSVTAVMLVASVAAVVPVARGRRLDCCACARGVRAQVLTNQDRLISIESQHEPRGHDENRGRRRRRDRPRGDLADAGAGAVAARPAAARAATPVSTVIIPAWRRSRWPGGRERRAISSSRGPVDRKFSAICRPWRGADLRR